MSCTGKVLIIKSVILPIMLYVSVIFPPPDGWVRKMTRLLFLFFWGGRMEKCAREKITKPRAKGGFGLPKIGDFLMLHYWVTLIRTLRGNGIGKEMMQYLGGRLFTRWGLYRRALEKPQAWVVPQYFLVLTKIWEGWRLGGLGREVGDKKKLKAWIAGEIFPNGIQYLREKESVQIWKSMSTRGVTNRQRDISWMTFMGCLTTMSFLKSRDLVRSELCPREGCGGVEDVFHLFWNCVFAKEVLGKLKSFLREVVGVVFVREEMVVLGLWRLEKNAARKAWCFSVVYKEVMWDVRNIWVGRKRLISVEDAVRIFLARMYIVYLFDVKGMGEEEAGRYWKRDKWNVF